MTTQDQSVFERSHKAVAPWAALDPSLGPPLRAVLPDLVEEVMEAVRAGVPAYAGPFRGAFGRTVRIGVEQALAGFVELVESGPGARIPAREVYVGLGRGEVRQGRTLDALLAAYRAGAQVAWRRFARAATDAGAPPEALIRLAEAVFAFIDELSAASAEGHAQAAALAAGERRALLGLLLADAPVSEEELAAVAAEAAWRVPPTVAVVAFEHAEPLRLTGRLPSEALVGGADGAGRALIPDPDAPRRRDELRVAFRGVPAALGPTVPPARAATSAQRATAALALAAEGEELVIADDRLVDVLLLGDATLAEELADRALAPLDALPAGARDRLAETLSAWLGHQGEVRAAAEALHVHTQTVRYRLGRLRDVLGGALDDPSGRLALQLALRARQLRPSPSSPRTPR